jgi:DNA-binding MarR family transcriptional regulator
MYNLISQLNNLAKCFFVHEGLFMTRKAIPETLGYLLVQICRANRSQAQERLSQIGLHTGQEMFLLRLWRQDGQTQTELADEICVQPATITRMIDRLAKEGLVERRSDEEDRRVSRVYLTEAGRALQRPVENIWHELEQESFANLSLDEKVLLRRLLLQVRENLD